MRGTLNLNSGSVLNIRDNLEIGSSSGAYGVANINIDATSQLNLTNGSILIRGGNNNAQPELRFRTDQYAHQRQDFVRSLSCHWRRQHRAGQNNHDHRHTATNSDSKLNQFGTLAISGGSHNQDNTLIVNNVDIDFHSGVMNIANRQDAQNNKGTLTMTGSTINSLAGGLNMGITGGTGSGTLNLNSGSVLNVRDSLVIAAAAPAPMARPASTSMPPAN